MYRMRTIGLRWLKIISLILALLLILDTAWDLLYVHRNWDEDRISGFFQEPNDSLDVVFVGASDISRGYAAGVGYKEYGITSYSFTINGDAVYAWESQVDEAMEQQNPDAIVIEVNGALYSSEDEDEYQMYRSAVDRMVIHLPFFSGERIGIIWRYMCNTGDWASALRLLLPLYEYHSNQPESFKGAAATILSNLFRSTDNDGVTTLRGYECISGQAPIGGIDSTVMGSDLKEELDPAYEKELRRFLAHCKKAYPDQKILFIRMPHLVVKGEKRVKEMYARSNRIGEILEEYGYEYLNFEHLRTEIGIDDSTDFYDDNHLNVGGTYKFTRYFSEYLLQDGVTPSTTWGEGGMQLPTKEQEADPDVTDYGQTGSTLSAQQLRQWAHTAKMTDYLLRYCEELTAEGVNGQELCESYDLFTTLYERYETGGAQ